MTYVLRYLESADEVLEQLADLHDLEADPQWAADHPGVTATDFAEAWAPLYVFDGGVTSLGGFDSAELAAQSGAMTFLSEKAAKRWITAHQGTPGLAGTFEIVEVAP